MPSVGPRTPARAIRALPQEPSTIRMRFAARIYASTAVMPCSLVSGSATHIQLRSSPMIPPFTRALRTYGVMLMCASTVCRGASPASNPNSTGGFLARVEALAVLETFNAELLSHDSATLTLERWCDAHKLASPARIVASRVMDVD